MKNKGVEEVLSSLYGFKSKDRAVCTCGTFDKDHDCFKERAITQARHSLWELVKGAMPERDNYLHYPFCKGTITRDCTCGASNHNKIWNECLDDTLANLEKLFGEGE